MAATVIRPEKVAAIIELKDKLSRAKTVVLADNIGLSVAEATKLRRELRAAGVEYRVAKNTLVRIALREIGVQGAETYLSGPTTMTISYDDHVAGARKLQEFFAKEKKPKLTVKGGLLDGKVIDAEGVKVLANLPPRDVLLAQILGGIQAPMVGFAGALNALLSSFAWALDARINQLGSDEADSDEAGGAEAAGAEA